MENHISTPTPPAPYHGTVILASNSQRRRDLLKMIIPEFIIAPSRDVEEIYSADTPAEQVPIVLSALKSEAYSDLVKAHTLLITADTVVILDGEILGKPHDRAQALEMLHALRGKTHHVITGVTLRTENALISFSETTYVNFSRLTDRQISEYVDIYRPYDKAGAYGIQEWIGAIGIESINGCYYNVMGLPLFALNRTIRTLASQHL